MRGHQSQLRLLKLLLVAAAAAAAASSGGDSSGAAAAAAAPPPSPPPLDAARILNAEPNERLALLAGFSDRADGLSRIYGSPAHGAAAEALAGWMAEAGLAAHIDAIGNVHGCAAGGAPPGAPEIVIGSHYDTVTDAGAFDGALGVVVGIAAAKWTLASLAAAGVAAAAAGRAPPALRRPLRVVAFCDEEGVRFKSTFLGSRALAGTLLRHGLLASADGDGVTLADALRARGVADPAAAVAALALPAGGVHAYLEAHIEQGPVLEAGGRPLGVVTAIAGQSRLLVTARGEQGHAGTVPMAGRCDALAAAAEAVLLIERRCGGGRPAAGAPAADDAFPVPPGDMLVCTVGELRVAPGAVNVIPGEAVFSVDIRSRSDELRGRAVAELTRGVAAACAARGVACAVELRHAADAVQSDAGLTGALAAAASASHGLARAAGTAGGEAGDVPLMVSGAGHDAMAMADAGPVAMLFVRCRGGVSHSPLEHAEPGDVAAAAAALATYLQREALGPEPAPAGGDAAGGGDGRDGRTEL